MTLCGMSQAAVDTVAIIGVITICVAVTVFAVGLLVKLGNL